jgi:hypothetical protein
MIIEHEADGWMKNSRRNLTARRKPTLVPFYLQWFLMTWQGIEPGPLTHSEWLGFRTVSIARILETRKRNVSETGSVSFLKRRQEDAYFVESLRANFNPWTQHSRCTFPVSPEEGNRSSFRNAVSSFVEYRTMDKVRKPSNSEGYTPSSEPFRIYLQTCYFEENYFIHIADIQR